MLGLHPHILEFEGQKAFVVLPYDEYLGIEVQLQELEDIRMLSQAKALEADVPTVSLWEFAARFANEQEQGKASPLDVESIALGVSTGDIVQCIAESPRCA